MKQDLSRRGWMRLVPLSAMSVARPAVAVAAEAVGSAYPVHPAERNREVVTVAHGNARRLRELVGAHPALSEAAIDWGFGDWETALGAASHVGNREIAEFLLERGARPTLFSAAMLGQLDVVRAMVAAQPGAQRIRGPHSISLLDHARAGGEKAAAVRTFLEELGGADSPKPEPLTEEDLRELAGTYVFGDGASERVEIVVKRGSVYFERPGTVSRGLFHLGGRVFHPAGASVVRIRFRDGEELTVEDPEVVLRAKRAAA